MGGIFNSDRPDRGDYAPVELDNDLKARYLGVLDKYMQDKGMTNFIPEENRPYELRNAQERGEMRAASGNMVTPQGTIQKPTLNDGLSFPEQSQALNEKNPRLKNAGGGANSRDQLQTADYQLGRDGPADMGGVFGSANTPERQVSSQLIAPTNTAPQMNQVPLTANTAFFQEDERRKQEEYNRVKDYVYRDNRSR